MAPQPLDARPVPIEARGDRREAFADWLASPDNPYFARAIVIAAFVLLPTTPLSVLAFAALMGLLWLSTVAPTSGLVAIMFGPKYMGTLVGLVFVSHQVGAFLGVWLAGRLYDQTGSYDVVWWLGVALGIFAAIVHLPIRERPAYAVVPA